MTGNRAPFRAILRDARGGENTSPNCIMRTALLDFAELQAFQARLPFWVPACSVSTKTIGAKLAGERLGCDAARSEYELAACLLCLLFAAYVLSSLGQRHSHSHPMHLLKHEASTRPTKVAIWILTILGGVFSSKSVGVDVLGAFNHCYF